MLAGLALAECDSPDERHAQPERSRSFFDRLRVEDQEACAALLCQDFRDNVNSKGEERDVSYPSTALHARGRGRRAAVDVAVYGKMEMRLRSDEVRFEVAGARTTARPWTVRVARMEGQWWWRRRVSACGATSYARGLALEGSH